MGRDIRHSRNTLIKARPKVGEDEIKTSGNVPNPSRDEADETHGLDDTIVTDRLFLEDQPNINERALRVLGLREILMPIINETWCFVSVRKTRRENSGRKIDKSLEI